MWASVLLIYLRSLMKMLPVLLTLKPRASAPVMSRDTWSPLSPSYTCTFPTLWPTWDNQSEISIHSYDQSDISIYLDILLTNIERVFWMLESWIPIIDVDQRDLDTGCVIVPEKSVSTGWFIINVSSPSIISSDIEVVTLSCLIVNSLPQYDLSSAVDTEFLLWQLLVVDIELNWSETTNQIDN